MLAETKRVFENIEILLQKGVFPGEMSPAIAEALLFINQAKNEVTTQIEGAASDGESNRNETDTSGLASSDVLPGARKSRKGRSK